MAYNGNKFLFTHVVADKPVSPDEPEAVLTPEEEMQTLEERLQEYSEGWNPDFQLSYEKTQENGKDGYNIHLPYGVDFRIEHGNITFSKFGLSKDELKNVYTYLSQLGISGLSFDPNERDEAFKQAAHAAEQELKNEDGLYEMGIGSAGAEEPSMPSPANNNTPMPRIDTTGLSEEDALNARREMAKRLRNNVGYTIPKESPKKEEVHPNISDIENYISTHVKVTHKDQSNNYRKIAIGNGYKLMWYKDADQKREGPKADKTGKVTPNFDAGLRAQIVQRNGKPHLSLSILTPKYGDAADWVFDEAMNLAAECKSTHVRFMATAAFKGKFLAACGKKMMVPTGVKIKEKEFNVIMKAAKENNDDPAKRAAFYKRFAEQLEDDLIRSGDNSNPDHPYNRMIKNLQIQIAVEGGEERFKRFNNFYEKNIQGKAILDKNNKPIDTFKVKDKKEQPNAAKELAMGRTYVDLLSQYLDNPNMKNMSDEQLMKKYLELYNKNLYLAHNSLKEKLDGLTAMKEIKEAINSEYQLVQRNINAIQAKVNFEGFDKIMTPKMDKYTSYNIAEAEINMAKRLGLGKNSVRAEKRTIPLNRNMYEERA